MWQENDDNSNHEFAENDPELWDSLMAVRAKGFKSSDPEHYNIYFSFHSPLVYLYNPDNYKRMPKDPTYPNNFNIKLYYHYVGDDGDFIVGNEIAKYEVTDQLINLKMPVLIIAGRYDRVSVPKLSVLYKKYCPQATFLMLNRSGHNPQIEEPELYFSAVRKFLK